MRRSGQALIELVAVLPLLLVIVIGVLEVGTLLYEHERLSAGMAEVGKVAFTNGRSAQQLQQIFDATSLLDTSKRTFTVTTMAADPDMDGLASLTFHVAWDHEWIGFWNNGSTTITIHSELRTAVATQTGVAGLLVPP